MQKFSQDSGPACFPCAHMHGLERPGSVLGAGGGVPIPQLSGELGVLTGLSRTEGREANLLYRWCKAWGVILCPLRALPATLHTAALTMYSVAPPALPTAVPHPVTSSWLGGRVYDGAACRVPWRECGVAGHWQASSRLHPAPQAQLLLSVFPECPPFLPSFPPGILIRQDSHWGSV